MNKELEEIHNYVMENKERRLKENDFFREANFFTLFAGMVIIALCTFIYSKAGASASTILIIGWIGGSLLLNISLAHNDWRIKELHDKLVRGKDIK